MINQTQLSEQLPHLRRYARSLTGDGWSADDLVQDTLERACVKWRLWSVGSDLRAWLLTMMHNVYLNKLRGMLPASASVDIEDVAHELQAPRGHVDDSLDLSRCLQKLPADQRAVLLLVTVPTCASSS